MQIAARGDRASESCPRNGGEGADVSKQRPGDPITMEEACEQQQMVMREAKAAISAGQRAESTNPDELLPLDQTPPKTMSDEEIDRILHDEWESGLERLDALENAIRSLRAERDDARGNLDMANDALRVARGQLGEDDRPFIDDAIRNLQIQRDEAQRSAEESRNMLEEAPIPERESVFKGEEWQEGYADWWHERLGAARAAEDEE